MKRARLLASFGPSRLLCFTFLLLTISTTILGQQQEEDNAAHNNASIQGVTPSYPSLLGVRQAPQVPPEAPVPELPVGVCSATQPCSNQACCNGETFVCGYDPNGHCSPSKCISNCDAKAECGEFASPVGKQCPIHVCCSKHGFCGATPDFCDASSGCQSNCGQPPKTSPHTTDVRELVIGYVEAWAFGRRGCANRAIDAIKVDSVTHIYVSFAFIKPGTYEVHPMPGVSESDIFALTNLKRTAPGLKVWIAIGGWTFSDDGTDTQPVFGDLSSTTAKRERFLNQLEKFMIYYGFDGVDYDWEYPGAPDRGGHPEDGANFVALVRDTRTHFRGVGRGWGISFTAPSSYWYMQHFDIEHMMPHVDWINLMTYDLFGSWDANSSWIGPHVYGHTNLTVIQDALNLMWRNNVPANQVNLGLGFYGRSYTLADPTCDKPGCDFTEGGRAGVCSGAAGYMSYQDIAATMSRNKPVVVTDETAAVKYFRYDTNQWVSFDDAETLGWKIDFANSQGLRGLFIWALTQDTEHNDLLDAVLQPIGLGKFRTINGVHSIVDPWETSLPDTCSLSTCGGMCKPGLIDIGQTVRCELGNEAARSRICCPIGGAYNPRFCRWRAEKSYGWCGSLLSTLGGWWFGSGKTKCLESEATVVSSRWFIDSENRDDHCPAGEADYCCDNDRPEDGCRWSDVCEVNDDILGTGCRLYGAYMYTSRRGTCRAGADWETRQPFCCDSDMKPDCYWESYDNRIGKCTAECKTGYVSMGAQYRALPGTEDLACRSTANGKLDSVLCCKKNSIRGMTKMLPVPVEYLFDEAIGSDEEQTFDIDTAAPKTGQSEHPNDNGFGWHIMSGPPSQLTSLSKRDGSHWEVYECDQEHHEGVQSARMVCTREHDHNCDDIHLGTGVADTIVEMPPGCGPGKYAMAISLEPMHDASADHKMPRLVKRSLHAGAVVYNLTFDYGFHRLHGRADNEVKIRIDYSNAPDYWNEIVAAAPTRKRDMSSIQDEVDRDHGGDWKRYVDHAYHLDKRSTPPEELHLLHERWYTAHIEDWIARIGRVQQDVDVLDQRIQKTFIYKILDERRTCPVGEVSALIQARISVDVRTSGVMTLIGHVYDLSSFRHSYVNFRNKGEVRASLEMEAHGELKIPYKEDTLIGIAPLGASFKIPGIVTIGPDFKLAASVEGNVAVTAKARVDFNVTSWDYAQRYPGLPSSPSDFDDAKPPIGQPPSYATTDWSVTAEGLLALHLIPMVTFGVDFDPAYAIPSAKFDFGVDTYARVHGFAMVGQTTDFEYCVGAEAGYDVFAAVTAPKLFNLNLNRRWSLISDEKSIFQSGTCPASAAAKRRRDEVLRRWLDGEGGEERLVVDLEEEEEEEGKLVEVDVEEKEVHLHRHTHQHLHHHHHGHGHGHGASPVSSSNVDSESKSIESGMVETELNMGGRGDSVVGEAVSPLS